VAADPYDRETEDAEDASFDALLKRAAHVSGPTLSSLGARLQPGNTLFEGRLRVVQRIGEGGMGVVYEVHDVRRGGSVALKTLSRLDPSSVYRLKNEFRSLADVSHPNLCRLYELFGVEGDWFFTMELVKAERFDSWVRPNGVLDEARLRAALPQLRDGIAAIHSAGKLHRDLKPSNVLVTPEGRVVVLDFGLAVDWDFGGVGQTILDQSVSGTPAYMAPEQAACEAASAASDLYALGVMLFEALTGSLPFGGRIGAMLAAKQQDAAPRVSTIFSGAPSDLASLCDMLLERNPALRPDSAALQEKLGPAAGSSSIVPVSSAPARALLFGREDELSQLRSGYRATLERRPVVMFVAGQSGIGKSALVTHFLEELRAEGRVAAFAGRCYERESVPFKAFDAVVDDLSRYLRKLTRSEAGDLMPREVFALMRLFPVLERVDAVAEAPTKHVSDLQELQQRAFAAFFELLGRLRDRRPVVVFIDDLQWTDQDSTAFLTYLLAQPEPTPLLLIASHRVEGADDNARLQQTFDAARANPRIDCRTLSVGPLADGAAHALAQRMLGSAASERDHVAAIAREAQGSPFFLGELVRQTRVAGVGPRQLTLREAVLRHVQGLGPGARSLLEVLAIAGRPMAVQCALEAAETEHDAVDALLGEHLLRVAGAGHERTLECYHDKIRESAADALSADALCSVHGRLAVTLERHDADPEQLAMHWRGAGESERAATYYEQAGDRSAGGPLAFEHAAQQYEQALLLGTHTDERRRGLHKKLGAALAAAGRCLDAAHAYQAAAAGAPAEEALDATRTAAHYLMTSGHTDAGRELLGDVLRAIGLAFPSSRRAALGAALLSRARLTFRGLKLRETRGTPVSRDAEARLGALWTVVQGSVANDPFLMVEMSARYARLALDEGSHAHAARALAMEAYIVSFDGAATRARNEKLLTQARSLAERGAAPEILGWVYEIEGNVLVQEGRFAEAKPALDVAIDWLQQRCTAVPFELASARVYRLNAMSHLGEFAEISTHTPGLVEDAFRRGDLYQANLLGTGLVTWSLLAHRGASDAKARLEEAKRRAQPHSAYQWSDLACLLSELSIALYEDRAQDGLAMAAEQWPGVEASQLLRTQFARALMLYARGGCAVSAARQSGGAAKAERSLARALARQLHATRVPYARGFGAVLQAGLELDERKLESAAAHLRVALASFDASALRMHAAAARRTLGQLLGGDDGRASVAEGDAAMAVEAVCDVERTTSMLVPGCRVAASA
jgi:eukaryotic-like serine/threonine-protein kinase